MVLLFLLLLFLHRKYDFKYELKVGWIISVLFLLLGIVIYSRFNQPPVLFSGGKFAATVLETPEEKPNSYKSFLIVNAFYRNDSVFNTKEKVLVYFEKSKAARLLRPGTTILFDATPREIKNNGNPFEFDYRQYMEQKKIYRQVYLKSASWLTTEINKSSLVILSEKVRDKLLTIYRNQHLGDNETEILSALTLGYKRGLDPETKQVFSAAGAMHVLAVSGLHVGILFTVFSWIFGFLQKKKSGKYLFVLGALFLLWGYAFLTGLSPSVLRATTMFSLYCIATNIDRKPNIYNSLSIAAFVLLVINPNNLFEVGFQLSFAAVFGIVFLQPRFSKIWPVRNRILKFFWTLFTVSVAAQIATFPLTSYYFNQFPAYFWLSNLVIIPAVFLFIVLGIGLLLFSQVPILSVFLAFATKWSIHYVYYFLQKIENLPGSVLDISINVPQTFLLVLTFAMLFTFITSHRRLIPLKLSLISCVLMISMGIINRLSQLTHSEIIVYNNSSNPVIHLISGEENYVISEYPIKKNEYIFQQIETVKRKKQLEPTIFLTADDTIENQTLFIKNRIISFNGKTVRIDSDQSTLPHNFKYDLLISRKANYTEKEEQEPTVFISLSSYASDCTNPKFFPMIKRGAYHQSWTIQPN